MDHITKIELKCPDCGTLTPILTRMICMCNHCARSFSTVEETTCRIKTIYYSADVLLPFLKENFNKPDKINNLILQMEMDE